MAKISNIPPMGRSTRRPGLLVMTKTRGGVPVSKSWPKKRGKKASEEQLANQERFALAQRAANEAHPWQYMEAANMSHGTIWNRREMLVKAANGTLYEIKLANGEFYGNCFILAREIQPLLDTVTDEPGSILVRGPDGWVGLAPGADGYFLASNGAGFAPSWEAAAAAPTVYQWSSSDINAVYAGANVTVGNQYVPIFDVEVVDITLRLAPVAGKTYSLCIATLSAGNVITAIHQLFDITAAVTASPLGCKIPLPVAQTFTAGVKYGVFVSTSNGPAGAGCPLWQPFQGDPPFPLRQRQIATFFNVAVPTVGQVCVTGGGEFSLDMRWRGL